MDSLAWSTYDLWKTTPPDYWDNTPEIEEWEIWADEAEEKYRYHAICEILANAHDQEELDDLTEAQKADLILEVMTNLADRDGLSIKHV